ncbi:MAG: hypothetical protein V8R30_05380 [Clostridia bacterium]
MKTIELDKDDIFGTLENPYSGYLKRFLGKPALVFDPFEYGDPYIRKLLYGESLKN